MRKHSSRRLKVFVALAALVGLLASVSVAQAGARWTGIDPELMIGDEKVNIVVAVPPGQWCNIDGPIEFEVFVPDVDDAYVVFESEGEMGRGRNTCYVSTQTTLTEHNRGDDVFGVRGRVMTDRGNRSFPVDVVVSVNDVEQIVCYGKANSDINCGPISLDD